MPKRIDKLTKEQEAEMSKWRDRWIGIGLKTGETDWNTFDEYMPICFKKANIPYPKNIVRVSSPLVGGLAAAISEKIWQKIRKKNDDAVRGAVGDAKLEWHYWLGAQFWVGGWWGSPAFVSFFTEVCGLKLNKDIMERAEAYQRVCESVNYIWPNRNFIIVCSRPTKILRDENGRLHSEVGQAIEYPDGWGLYMLHGVKFEKDLWQKAVSGKMSFKEILDIQNTEQRLQATRYNPNALMKENPKLINKTERGNELYLIEKSEVNKLYDAPKVWLLKFQDPSKQAPNNFFIEEVDPEFAEKHQNADEVNAYHSKLTLAQYQLLKIET